MTAQQFNQQYPIGTAFKFFPIMGLPAFEETTTRSEAWALGHGAAVVKVEGRAGGVSIEHLELIEVPK